MVKTVFFLFYFFKIRIDHPPPDLGWKLETRSRLDIKNNDYFTSGNGIVLIRCKCKTHRHRYLAGRPSFFVPSLSKFKSTQLMAHLVIQSRSKTTFYPNPIYIYTSLPHPPLSLTFKNQTKTSNPHFSLSLLLSL
jgi:hypothetical protein